jgi:hypothetical protein
MRASDVTPDEAQEHFWSVVRACIREFHREQSSFALSRASRIRKKVEQMPTAERELFFHAEPFDVACRLADNPLNVADYLRRYLQIRDHEDLDG